MFKFRPKVISLNSVCTNKKLSIKLCVGLEPARPTKNKKITPISRLTLLKKNKFNIFIKVLGKNESHEQVVTTDSFGNAFLKQELKSNIDIEFKVYVNDKVQNVRFFLGSFRPSTLDDKRKIIISDFDKTLVDTKYSTLKELYNSLTKPVSDFPQVKSFLKLFKDNINDGYLPFILSSSPNFYGPTIKQWLSEQGISDQNIFLKDYRHFFSFFSTELFFKDISTHGVHKLNSLIDIFLMTEIPNHIVLLGDSSEADPLIYSIFYKISLGSFAPDDLWDEIKTKNEFRLTDSQSLQFLGKLYEVKNKLSKKKKETVINIFIRNVPGKKFKKQVPSFIKEEFKKINFY